MPTGGSGVSIGFSSSRNRCHLLFLASWDFSEEMELRWLFGVLEAAEEVVAGWPADRFGAVRLA